MTRLLPRLVQEALIWPGPFTSGYGQTAENPADLPVLNRLFTLNVKDSGCEGGARVRPEFPLARAGSPGSAPDFDLQASMKLGVPWSVKGIRPEARETAKQAA